PAPVRVEPPQKLVVLARQPRQRRWILHLLDDGPCTVEIRREFVPASKVVGLYPPAGWTCTSEKTAHGLQIKTDGAASDRLVVLQ
ncbi:MAG: hypothetical protein N3B01_12645, partial [Verrucomicrobiae bacterium]|nr:hypothetical protein [Verrucomicrobiae bacterium]